MSGNDSKSVEKNPIDEFCSTVKSLQMNVSNVGDQQKSNKILDNLENQQKLILEQLQKMSKTEAQKKAEEEKKPSVTSIISPGFLTASSGIPQVGRSFVLKRTFKNVSKFDENKWNCSEDEDHFGVPWHMIVCKKEQHLQFYLQCNKSLETGKWVIDTKFTLKLIGANGKIKSGDCEVAYGNVDENKKSAAWGLGKFTSWEEMKKDYLLDDNLTAEVHVKINKMTGVYKEKIEQFGEILKSVSDVVLKVRDQKFYVLRKYLACHSIYFSILFLGQFKESKKSEIELTGIDPEDFNNYVEVLYGVPNIDDINVEGILVVAGMYNSPMVIGKCENFMLLQSGKPLKKKLQMAIRYNLKGLKTQCISEIKTVADVKALIPENPADLEHAMLTQLLEKLVSLR